MIQRQARSDEQRRGSAPTPQPAKLEARGVGKVFAHARGGSDTEALRDVSLTVAAGRFVSLVGASGCGKTTMLRLVDGLTPPSSGGIWLDGERIVGPGPDRGFVFQSDALLPWRSVLDNVAFGLEARGVEKKEARKLAMEQVALVGLTDFEDSYPHEISGGMKQRVNLARALAIDPEVLLMDEPFAALDAQTREIMQGELLRIWGASQKTVLFVTHQIDEAVYLSDEIVVLSTRPGRVREIVPVNIERPRDLSIKRSEEFVEIVDRVWSLIEKDVMRSVEPQ